MVGANTSGMRTLFLLTIIALVSLLSPAAQAACTINYLKGQLNNLTLTHQGLTREFRVWVPADHSTASPLVFVLHGGGGSSLQIQAQTRFEDVATNALVVYPDGTGAIQTWNAGICCGAALRDNVDDIGFVSKMIDTISQNACVDAKRIYSTGMSNGAMMTQRIGCDLSTKFAAIASVAAQLQMDVCAPVGKLGVMMIHGFSDFNVPFTGGQGCGLSSADYYNVSRAVSFWTAHDACPCQGFNSSCAHFNISISTGQASCTEYCYGPTNPRVQTCFGNWTHTWPRVSYADQEHISGCPATFGPSDFNATQTVWDFFQQHSLVDTNAPTASPTHSGSSTIRAGLFLCLMIGMLLFI